LQGVSSLTPSLLRGLFFVLNPTETDFLFELIDPEGKAVVKIADKGQGAFVWNATLNGDYKFLFHNKKMKEKFLITFVFHHVDEKKKIVQSKDINKFENELEISMKKLKVFHKIIFI
jgi:hypothetical protein